LTVGHLGADVEDETLRFFITGVTSDMTWFRLFFAITLTTNCWPPDVGACGSVVGVGGETNSTAEISLDWSKKKSAPGEADRSRPDLPPDVHPG
jgi:hypothetical protein